MAVNNWINYAAIAPQKSPLEGFFADILRGYKMQREPAKMDQEQKQRELVSRLAELDLQHKPTEYSLADALKRAQAQKASAPSAASMNPLEKIMLQEQLRERLATDKENRKTSLDLENQASDMLNVANDVSAIQEDLSGGNYITGIPGYLNEFASNLSQGKYRGDEAAANADLQSRAVKLQASLARLMSSRGGAVVAGMVEAAKPSKKHGTQHNRNLVKSLEQQIRSEYKVINDRYKQINGRNLPVSLDEVFKMAEKEHNKSLSENDPLGIR